MEFKGVSLRDMSWDILQFLHEKEPMKAARVAEEMGLTTRQVDAAITKSLVRYGFVKRFTKFTRLQEKPYSVVQITPRGERYYSFRKSEGV